MDRAELERLLRDTESDRVERTTSLTDTAKFSEAVCAFANDMPSHRKPGYLFLGANPDGSASGVPITDQLLQNLAAIRSDGHIQPLPAINVQKWPLGGGEMAVVEVFPSDLPPVRYKGRVHIRVGPRRALANEAEDRQLSERRTLLARTWDARPCPAASLDDLALDLFVLSYRPNAVSREVLDANDRDLREQLSALRFYDLKTEHPTNAAVLLFAKDPLYFCPGAYIQYVAYASDSQAGEVTRDLRVAGDLLSVMRELDRLADEVARARPARTASGQPEQMVYDYPPRALHELLMNAVIHRNYDGGATPTMCNHFVDRIELLSPGGLYPDLTPEQFPHGTAYRNPILAEAARTLGFVNRYGRGIAIAQDELTRNGSRLVEFDTQPNFFLATVRKRP